MSKKGFAFKLKGPEKITKKLKEFKAEVLSGQVRAVQDATLLLHETAVKSIQAKSGGEPQVRYGPKRTVLASKPGSPPNTDTGRLVQSIKLDFKDNGLRGRVGTNLKYGAHLEFGTKNMEPRPWLSSAVTEISKAVAKIFKDAMTKEIKGAGK